MRTKIFGLMVAITAILLFAGCAKTTDSPDPVTPNPTPDAVISLLAISGVTAPVYGATPVTTITETAQYTGTVAWSGTPATFGASTVYTATITLTAKAGYTLSGVAANSFTVAGATATNPVNSGVVTAEFPATGDGSYSSVNIGTLKYVPAGTFQRDATATNTSTVSAFRMSQHEITRAQFLAIMGTDPSNAIYSSGTTDPVQSTNWYHAIAFCNKLSIAEGLTPVYSVSGVTDWTNLPYVSIPTTTNADWNATTANWAANGYRLPTEMEWMWAAMGATSDRTNGYTGTGTNTTGYQKAFAGSTGSNAIGDYAVFGYYGSETGRTTTESSNSVGSKTTGANELGLYDMSGNVWEWNWDWSGTYPTGSQTDYRGAASGTYRVLRGGSWTYDASYCTVAIRYICNPNGQGSNIGFRVVRP
jgi:sulfatase modifying factor 1